MIDSVALATLDEEARKSVLDSFKTLTRLGIFTAQVAVNNQRVVEGFTNESAKQLATRILEVQQTNRQLLALHELAETLKEE